MKLKVTQWLAPWPIFFLYPQIGTVHDTQIAKSQNRRCESSHHAAVTFLRVTSRCAGHRGGHWDTAALCPDKVETNHTQTQVEVRCRVQDTQTHASRRSRYWSSSRSSHDFHFLLYAHCLQLMSYHLSFIYFHQFPLRWSRCPEGVWTIGNEAAPVTRLPRVVCCPDPVSAWIRWKL